MADDKSRRTATVEALQLFHKIAKRLGADEATRIFSEIAARPALALALRSRREWNNAILLALHDQSGLSIPQLFEVISSANRNPKNRIKIGSGGLQSPTAFERHMSRLRAKRKR